MNEQNMDTSILKFLEDLALAGVTFIRDYIQFLFDDAVLNTYTLPQIRTEIGQISSAQHGYCDALCSLIGKRVLHANEYAKEEKIVIQFEDDKEITISLKLEDRVCAEAAMFQIWRDRTWNVW